MLIAKKRANGEGSIWKRHDGRWECAMVVGTDPSGKKIRKTALAKTHKEIIIKMNDLRRQYFGTVLVSDENLTITEWLEKWLNDYKKPFIREGTYIGYMNAMKHINDNVKVGHRALNARENLIKLGIYLIVHRLDLSLVAAAERACKL